MEIYICLVRSDGGTLMILNIGKQLGVGDEVLISMANSIHVPGCSGILPGRYKITKLLETCHGRINRRKQKIHCFEVIKL